MKKNLDIAKLRYSEHILPVPCWSFVISSLHCITGILESFFSARLLVDFFKLIGLIFYFIWILSLIFLIYTFNYYLKAMLINQGF